MMSKSLAHDRLFQFWGNTLHDYNGNNSKLKKMQDTKKKIPLKNTKSFFEMIERIKI